MIINCKTLCKIHIYKIIKLIKIKMKSPAWLFLSGTQKGRAVHRLLGWGESQEVRQGRSTGAREDGRRDARRTSQLWTKIASYGMGREVASRFLDRVPGLNQTPLIRREETPVGFEMEHIKPCRDKTSSTV